MRKQNTTTELCKQFKTKKTLMSILTVLFCLFISIAMVACGGGKESTPDSTSSTPSESITPGESSTPGESTTPGESIITPEKPIELTEAQKIEKIKGFLELQDINLIDLDGKTSYDLKDAVSEDDKVYIEEIDGTLYWEMMPMYYGTNYSGSSSVLDFTKVEKANYAVVAYDDYMDVKTPVYAFYADFYDEKDGFVWNDFTYTDADTDKILLKADEVTTSADAIDDIGRYYTAPLAATTITGGIGPDGKPGNWYQIESQTNETLGYVEGVWATFSPKHSRAYYEQYWDYNYQISYSFAMWGEGFYSAVSGNEVPDNAFLGFYGTSVGKSVTAKAEDSEFYKRYQIVSPFKSRDDIKVYNYTVSINNWVADDWFYMVHQEYRSFASRDYNFDELRMTHAIMWVGNFQIGLTSLPEGEVEKEVATSTKLVDLKSAQETSVDLATLMTKNTEYLTDPDYEGSVNVCFTDNNGNVVTNNGTVMEYSNLKKRAYKAEVKIGYTVIFECTVDLYNSDDAVVWNDDLSVKNVNFLDLWGATLKDEVVKNGTTCSLVDIESEELANSDRTGKYFKLTTNSDTRITFSILPIHSKDYYALYKDYTLSVDIYLTNIPDTVKNINELVFGGLNQKHDGLQNKDCWKTFNTVGGAENAPANTLERYVENWESFITGAKNVQPSGQNNYFFFDYAANPNAVGSWGSVDMTIYIGNVQLTAPATAE